MSNVFRAGIFVIGGLLWFLFALVFGFFALQYASQGAGVGLIVFSVSSGGVLMGLVHFLGFLFASGLCFVIGIGLCAHGFVPPVRQKVERRIRPLMILRYFLSRQGIVQEPSLRCVRCEGTLGVCVHICPECGWTQPYEKAA
jgi:hypothetical protein